MSNILEEKVIVINLGLKQFSSAIEQQNEKVIHVEWKPPSEDSEEIENMLDSLL